MTTVRTTLVIIGGGGHGRVCLDAGTAAGFEVVAFCDTRHPHGALINGVPVVASTIAELKGEFSPDTVQLFVAIGDNASREALMRDAIEHGYVLATLIHPSATISPSAVIGRGTVVMPGVVINANATIGRGCIINTAASVDHDCVVGDFAQICPGVRLAGGVQVGHRTFLGTGAIAVPRVSIGENAIVGAGAVVLKSVASHSRVAGVPAVPF